MPNGTYGGVRGKETKVGQKTFVSRPTRFPYPGPWSGLTCSCCLCPYFECGPGAQGLTCFHSRILRPCGTCLLLMQARPGRLPLPGSCRRPIHSGRLPRPASTRPAMTTQAWPRMDLIYKRRAHQSASEWDEHQFRVRNRLLFPLPFHANVPCRTCRAYSCATIL